MGKYYGPSGDKTKNIHFRFPNQTRKLPFKCGIVGTQTYTDVNYKLKIDNKGHNICTRNH